MTVFQIDKSWLECHLEFLIKTLWLVRFHQFVPCIVLTDMTDSRLFFTVSLAHSVNTCLLMLSF